MTTQGETIHSKVPYRGAATMLTLMLTVALGFSAGPVAAGAPDRSDASGTAATAGADRGKAAKAAIPGSVTTSIARADSALDRAIANVGSHHPRIATTALLTVKDQVSIANRAAMAQIGLPPTDPESDVPPGPPSVLAVLRLEHRVGTGVVGLFDGTTRASLVDALRLVLTVDHHRRDAMLDAVIALPPEGAGADYADGMADTLGLYKQEVQQVSTALDTYQLTDEGRVGLTNALQRVQATKAKVDAAFGGGE
jgi:hypothetical protein